MAMLPPEFQKRSTPAGDGESFVSHDVAGLVVTPAPPVRWSRVGRVPLLVVGCRVDDLEGQVAMRAAHDGKVIFDVPVISLKSRATVILRLLSEHNALLSEQVCVWDGTRLEAVLVLELPTVAPSFVERLPLTVALLKRDANSTHQTLARVDISLHFECSDGEGKPARSLAPLSTHAMPGAARRALGSHTSFP